MIAIGQIRSPLTINLNKSNKYYNLKAEQMFNNPIKHNHKFVMMNNEFDRD